MSVVSGKSMPEQSRIALANRTTLSLDSRKVDNTPHLAWACPCSLIGVAPHSFEISHTSGQHTSYSA